jgi:hypothetical protein
MAILRRTRAAPLSHIISSRSCEWRVTGDLLGKQTTQTVQQTVTPMTGTTSQRSWRRPLGELALGLDTCGTRFPRGCSGQHFSLNITILVLAHLYDSKEQLSSIPQDPLLPCLRSFDSLLKLWIVRWKNHVHNLAEPGRSFLHTTYAGGPDPLLHAKREAARTPLTWAPTKFGL